MSDPITRLNAALEGRYHIEGQLGEGGMATVYLADDLRHERKVAVKVLKPELAAVVGAERFLAEIKTTANLQHPHILPLHDSGEAGGFLYYVMPYVEGESLRERLDREQQLDVQDSLTIARKVAGALDYAHAQGVIHRDIKPGNILLSRQGEPLVADFGIALAVAQAGGGRITETGLSLGTPHYMSPEQATGDQTVGPATDTYALACVLYEMLLGEPPYTGNTAQAVLGKIIAGQVASASMQRPAIGANVDAAIRKALEKLPADRFTSAQAFASALTDPGFHYGAAASARAGRGAGPWNRLSKGLAGLSVVLTAALGLSLFRPEARPPVTRFVLQTPEGVTLGGVCCGPTQELSPDGEWLAFTGVGGGPIYRRRLGQLSAEPIPGTDGGRMPFFSPDSRWLGFYQDGRLRRIPMTGGPPQSIAEVPEPASASWGDNDVIVFVENSDGSLHTVPVAGGVPTPVVGPSESAAYNNPWMLPGGEAALMTVRAPNTADVRMVVVDLATGVADTLGFGTLARYAMGNLVFSGADGTLLVQPFDPSARRTTGQSVAILDGVGLNGPSIGQFAVSAQGSLAYQSGASATGQALTVVGPGGSVALELPEQGNLEYPAFSPPDGRRIAMQFVNVGENQAIWIWDRDQESLTIFTVEGARNITPVWTPDGSRIAFASAGGSEPLQIYWQAADGSGTSERLLETEYNTVPQSWSPDGQTLALQGRPQGDRGTDIGLLELGDTVPTWVVATEFNERQPQISPDGAWLAYSSDRSGQLEVYVEPMGGAGSRTTVSTDGGHSPRWAPDDDIVYYASGTANNGTVIAATYATDGGFRVTSRAERFLINDLNPTGGVNYDVSPDGQEFVHISVGGAGGRQLVWILNWPEIVEEMTSVR